MKDRRRPTNKRTWGFIVGKLHFQYKKNWQAVKMEELNDDKGLRQFLIVASKSLSEILTGFFFILLMWVLTFLILSSTLRDGNELHHSQLNEQSFSPVENWNCVHESNIFSLSPSLFLQLTHTHTISLWKEEVYTFKIFMKGREKTEESSINT